jgi:dihydropteroate synthase
MRADSGRQACNIAISIDTTKAVVVQQSIEAGADVINDHFTFDDQMLCTVAALNIPSF